MLRGLILVTATVISVGACGGGSSPNGAGTAASCVGPRLAVTPHAAHAGDTVQAAGEWFAADCYDTGQAGLPPPLTGLRLQVSQSGHTWTVASGIAASGDHFTFQVPFRLPTELAPGAATVAVGGYGAPAEVHVAAG